MPVLTRTLSDTKRPPGNPWVGSIGYVPPLATSATRGMINDGELYIVDFGGTIQRLAVTLAQVLVSALRTVSASPNRWPNSAPIST